MLSSDPALIECFSMFSLFVREGDLLVCIYFLFLMHWAAGMHLLYVFVWFALRRYGVPCTPIMLHAVPGA